MFTEAVAEGQIRQCADANRRNVLIIRFCVSAFIPFFCSYDPLNVLKGRCNGLAFLER